MFVCGLQDGSTDELQRIASRCSVSLVAGSVHTRCYWWHAADCLAVQYLVGCWGCLGMCCGDNGGPYRQVKVVLVLCVLRVGALQMRSSEPFIWWGFVSMSRLNWAGYTVCAL